MIPMEREALWQSVEERERKGNSIPSRSFEIALPLELNQDQRRWLSQDFARQICRRFDTPTDLSIHEPTIRKKGSTGAENPHAHLQIPDRDQHGAKLRQLSQFNSGEVEILRAMWERTVRRHLDHAGLAHVPFTMKKHQPPLVERIATNETQIRKLDRQIAAIERAIARLAARAIPAPRGDHESGGPDSEIQTGGRIQGSPGRDSQNFSNEHTQRNEPRISENQGTPRENIKRDNSLEPTNTRHDQQPEHQAQRNIDRTDGTSRSPGTDGFQCPALKAIEALKYKLEQLQEEKQGGNPWQL